MEELSFCKLASESGVHNFGVLSLGVSAGDGGNEVLSPVFLVSFEIKHGVTTGEEETGVSIGVIASIPTFSVLANFCKLFVMEETRCSSSSLLCTLSKVVLIVSFLRDGVVTTTIGLSTVSFFVIVLEETVFFVNNLFSDVADNEFLALTVEFEETEDDLDEGNELTFALTFA